MKVTVIGCGYVGLVTGVGLATLGHEVVGVDVQSAVVDAINRSRPLVQEPGLNAALERVLGTGAYRASMTVPGTADVVLIAVQTPPRQDGSIDLTYVAEAVSQCADSPPPAGHRTVLAIRSTVVPGTTEGLVRDTVARVAGSRASAFGLASNPEFLREGTAIADFMNPDRIVIGASDSQSADVLEALYRPLGATIIHTSPKTAEMTKYASNALLATLISYSNEIGRICEAVGDVDVNDVMSILHQDQRLTTRVNGQAVRPGILSYLLAGCGYGGSCLPKDVKALAHAARQAGYEPQLLRAVDTVNIRQQEHILEITSHHLGGDLRGKRVSVLGLAFKSGTNDVRSSPGVYIAEQALRRGATVTVYDPIVDKVPALSALGADFAPDLQSAVDRAQAVIVATGDPEFKRFFAGTPANHALVVDGRRILDPNKYPGAYAAIGLSRRHG